MVQFGKNYFFLEIPINLKFPKKISFLSQRFAGAFFLFIIFKDAFKIMFIHENKYMIEKHDYK